MNLYLDPDLELALSTFYTLSLVLLGTTNPERSMEMTGRATDMKIFIRSTREIYPTDDAKQFLAFVFQYATQLLEA